MEPRYRRRSPCKWGFPDTRSRPWEIGSTPAWGRLSAAFLANMGRRGTSSIIALDWNTQGKLLWEQKSTSLILPNRPPDRNNNNRTVSFEGTPVADTRNVYVAVTDRREQTATYVACFDAETGASRWIRYLGAASPEVNNMFGMGMPMQFGMTAPGDFNHRLLSLDGPALYYQTNLGAVVALEAETGATLWVATYPRRNPIALAMAPAATRFEPGGRARGPGFRRSQRCRLDLRVRRRQRPLALEDRPASPMTSSSPTCWAWPRAGWSPPAIACCSSTSRPASSTMPGPIRARSLEGYGRGLLAGDLIYWPTANEIQVLDQRTASRAEPPIKLQETYHTNGGNLVAGDGYLIVAQADGLVVFCQNSRLIERYRDEIARRPDRAANYFRLARAAEAIGQDQLALESIRAGRPQGRSGETIDGISLVAAARDHRFRLLMRLAGLARKARRWDDASTYLDGAATVARSDAERLQARLLLADVLLDAARPREAVDICERLLPTSGCGPWPSPPPTDHRTIRADLLIADRLNAIVRDHGRGVYEAYDREAGRLFERGKAENDPRVLDELCRNFPVARVVPDALLELGSL